MMPIDVSLYLVTDRRLSLNRPLEEVVEQAVRGGVTLVQLREKECSSREFYELALRLKSCLAPYHVPLIINDRIDIALAVDADGLHIGQQDLPYPIARRLLGKEKIIGLSVESLDDARRAEALDVDYIAVSPLFNTPTKTDTAPALEITGLREISAGSHHPIVAIGGVSRANTPEIIRSGADGIAVVSAIMSAPSPQEAAASLRQLVDHAKLGRG